MNSFFKDSSIFDDAIVPHEDDSVFFLSKTAKKPPIFVKKTAYLLKKSCLSIFHALPKYFSRHA